MERLLPSRYVPFALCLALFLLALAILLAGAAHGVWLWRWLAVISGALCAVGIFDMAQRKHTLYRNFPVTAHIRTFFEFFRPMLRQYVVESDTEEVPFSHAQRALVYQRAKNVED